MTKEIPNPNFKDPGVPVFDLKVTWHEEDDTLYCVGNWHNEGLLQHFKSRQSNLDVLNGQLVRSINEWIKQKKDDPGILADGIDRVTDGPEKIADYLGEKKIETKGEKNDR